MSKKLASDLVAILSDLIALPSPYPPGTSVEICAYAARRLKKSGYKVEIATHKKGVDNVVARRKGKAKGPVIAFNAHVDTVGVGERAKKDAFLIERMVMADAVSGEKILDIECGEAFRQRFEGCAHPREAFP